ncbi:hypothetical protein CR513_59438, partial [Mucuna pruriens]
MQVSGAISDVLVVLPPSTSLRLPEFRHLHAFAVSDTKGFLSGGFLKETGKTNDSLIKGLDVYPIKGRLEIGRALFSACAHNYGPSSGVPPATAAAAICHCRPAAVYHCLSLPFCSSASFLPTPTFRILVGSINCLRLKMATTSSLSQGSIISFLGTPTITAEKLNWKNYRAWSDSVELWFLGQGFHDHLEKQEAEIPEENRAPWLKLDLEILRSFKTCYSF